MSYASIMGKALNPIEKVEFAGFAPTDDAIPTLSGLARRIGLLDEAHVALRESDNVTALWRRSRGDATRLLGLTSVRTFQAVLALPGAGIAEPAQLAGRRLALPLRNGVAIDVPRASACRGFHVATALAGLFADEVVYVDVPVPAAPAAHPAVPYVAELAALLRGDVEAIYVAGAAGVAAAARVGAVEVVDLGVHLDPMVRAGSSVPAALTVDAHLLDAEPERVVDALAALLRAAAWARSEPAAVTQLVAGQLGAEPADVVAAHGHCLCDQLALELGEDRLAALRAQRDFLDVHGFLASDVDLGAWVDPRPLRAAYDLLRAAA
jgi:ABC-type nitrate/sulfonate/bicarbonate transport system substrate-binding protein